MESALARIEPQPSVVEEAFIYSFATGIALLCVAFFYIGIKAGMFDGMKKKRGPFRIFLSRGVAGSAISSLVAAAFLSRMPLFPGPKDIDRFRFGFLFLFFTLLWVSFAAYIRAKKEYLEHLEEDLFFWHDPIAFTKWFFWKKRREPRKQSHPPEKTS